MGAANQLCLGTACGTLSILVIEEAAYGGKALVASPGWVLVQNVWV